MLPAQEKKVPCYKLNHMEAMEGGWGAYVLMVMKDMLISPPRYQKVMFRTLFSKQDLSKHCIGLVEAVLEIYGSAMRAWHPKPSQAFQVLCNCSLRDDIIMIQTSRFAASPRNLLIVSGTS